MNKNILKTARELLISQFPGMINSEVSIYKSNRGIESIRFRKCGITLDEFLSKIIDINGNWVESEQQFSGSKNYKSVIIILNGNEIPITFFTGRMMQKEFSPSKLSMAGHYDCPMVFKQKLIFELNQKNYSENFIQVLLNLLDSVPIQSDFFEKERPQSLNRTLVK